MSYDDDMREKVVGITFSVIIMWLLNCFQAFLWYENASFHEKLF